jgi:DNA repair protein RecO (recombination protein O)
VRRTSVTEGIVIRRTALPSGDVVATLLSEHGKWRGVARKGRLPGGNLGRLSLFHDVTVQFYRRHDDDLALLTQVKLNGALPNLSAPDVYPYAHVLAELTDALTVDVHLGEKVYTYLASGLRGLNRHSDPNLVSLVYAWKLLGLAGLAPNTQGCVHCGAAAPLVALDIAGGGLACQRCARGVPVDEAVAAELTRMIAGNLSASLRAPPEDRPQHWRLLARYVAYHVRELKSLASAQDATSGAGAAETGTAGD